MSPDERTARADRRWRDRRPGAGAHARAHRCLARGDRARAGVAARRYRHVPARERHARPARTRPRHAGRAPFGRDTEPALLRSPRPAAVRGRRHRALGARRAMPGDSSSRTPRSAARGDRRRAYPPRAGRGPRDAARRHCLRRVQRRNERRLRSRGRRRRDQQRRPPAHLRARAGAPARRPGRLAVRRGPPARGDDLVGDVGSTHGVPDRSDRRRSRLLLLRRGLTRETPTAPSAARPSGSRSCSPSSPIPPPRCSTPSTMRRTSTSR